MEPRSLLHNLVAAGLLKQAFSITPRGRMMEQIEHSARPDRIMGLLPPNIRSIHPEKLVQFAAKEMGLPLDEIPGNFFSRRVRAAAHGLGGAVAGTLLGHHGQHAVPGHEALGDVLGGTLPAGLGSIIGGFMGATHGYDKSYTNVLQRLGEAAKEKYAPFISGNLEAAKKFPGHAIATALLGAGAVIGAKELVQHFMQKGEQHEAP